MRQVNIDQTIIHATSYIELAYSDVLGVFLTLFSEAINRMPDDAQEQFARIITGATRTEFMMRALARHFPGQFMFREPELW